MTTGTDSDLPHKIWFSSRHHTYRHDGTNHKSTIDLQEDVRAYLNEERQFDTMLGPFKKLPIDSLHISPLMTRKKQGTTHQCIIVDLSFPSNYHSVNAAVMPGTYLNSQFLLTRPTIDNITSKVRQLGRGSLLYKIDVSRAFRHIRLDPEIIIYWA